MLDMVFWDVQHGSASYISTPNEKHIAIDLGQGSYCDSDKVFSPLQYLSSNMGVSRLDTLIITHPHRDHLDDIFNVGKLSPKSLVRPNHLKELDIRNGNRKDDQDILNKYFEVLKGFEGTIRPENNPLLPENNGGVRIKVFIPTSCSTTNLNNHSVVTVISYANSKIIIPGDNEPASWDELLELKDFCHEIRDTDILVAPHHGRESGFSTALFEHISPRLVIISDGRFCDTSATDRYSKKASGWEVHNRRGGSIKRKCLTTRYDGLVVVKFGQNQDGEDFIEVTID